MFARWKVEICCGSLLDVMTASRFPIDRIELNSALELGGLTPTIAELRHARSCTDLPIVCMDRPRSAGFCYDSAELEVMAEDAEILLENGADGIVFGALNPDHTVHEEFVRTMTRIFCVLAGVLLALSFVGVRYLSWFRQEPQDEVIFTDPVILSAVKASAGGGVITEELVSELTFLPLEDIPENWDELTKLPALKRIALPQTALLGQTEFPELPYTVELSGGEGE